ELALARRMDGQRRPRKARHARRRGRDHRSVGAGALRERCSMSKRSTDGGTVTRFGDPPDDDGAADTRAARRDYAEETLCAAILHEPELVVGLGANVEASDFSRPMRRAVFAAIDRMQREGVTLSDPASEIPFRLGEEFRVAGGHPALSRLLQPVNPNAPLLE